MFLYYVCTPLLSLYNDIQRVKWYSCSAVSQRARCTTDRSHLRRAAVRGTVYISTVNFNHCILLIQTLGSSTSARGIAELEPRRMYAARAALSSAAWESVAIATITSASTYCGAKRVHH